MKYALHTNTLNIKLLRSVCANSPSGIIICIPSSNVPLIANEVICKMLGYSESELQQLELDAFFDANDWRRLSGTLNDLTKSETTSARLQLRFFTRGGDRVQTKVTLSFIHEDEGAEYFMYVVEQGSSSEYSRPTLAEETYKTLLNAFNGAAVLLDTSRTILMANQVMADRYATTITNLIGKDVGMFFPVELAKSRKEYIQKVIATGHPLNFVDIYNGRTLDSTIYPIFDLGGSVIKLAVYSVDITDKTKVHQELHLKSFAIEESFNAMILALLDGTVTYVNKSFLELWRYQDLTDVIGKSGFHCFDNPDYVRELARSVEDSGQWEGELTAVRGDGTTAIVHVSGKLLINAKQEPLGLMATCIDITSKRKSELALIESEKRLSLIFNTSKDAQVLWRIDADDKFICEAANDMFITSMAKLSPEGTAVFIDLDIRVILSRVTITIEAIESYLVNYRKAIATGKKVTFQGDLDLFGAWAFFEITLDPVLDQDGRCTHLLMNSRDVTGRRRAELALLESEERLRLALVASKQGIYDLNVVTGEAEVTSEYASMLGFDPVTFKETHSFWKERLHPDDHEEVYRTFDDYVKGKCDEYRVEFRQQAVSGEWKWILSRGKIISYTLGGAPLRMIGTHTDITELKRVERELKESQHRLNTVLNNAPVILFSIDYNGMLTLTKGKALESLGLSGSDMTGRSFFELFENIPNAVESLKIALEGVSTRTTLRVTSNYFDTFYSPLHDERGIVVGAIGMGIDITDKVKAEQVLAAKNKELQEIIDALDQSSLVSMVDKKGVILKANKRFCDVSGYSQEELVGNTHRITNSGYHSKEFWKDLWQTVNRGELWRGEIKNRKKNGVEYWVNTVINPIHDEKGNITYYLSIRQDITELKRSEAIIIGSEERLRHAIGVAQIGIFEHDHLWNIMYWSPEHRNIFAWPAGGNITLEDYVNHIHPDDRVATTHALQLSHDPLGDGVFDLTHRIIDRRGNLKWIKVKSKTHFSGEGKDRVAVRTIGAIEDVTNHKLALLLLEQSELKFRSLYELAPVGIALNDFATGTFLDFNDALYRETGYTKEEFHKLTFWAITPPEYRDQEAEQLKSMRETGYYGPYEKEYIRKDGSRYAVLLTGVKLLDSEGREVIWSVIQDITDRKVYEKLLLQSNSRLAQIEKFIDLTTDAIQVADQEGRVVYLNHAALQRLNVSREVSNTLYVYDCEPLFETRDKWEEAIETLKEKSEFTAESLTTNPQTSETNVWEITVRYVTIQSQGYIITVSRDITERKRNEIRLRENEARLSEAQRMASLGYWDYDIATDKVWWSDELLNIVQIDESEMPVGQEDYVQLIHPDDREHFLTNTRELIDKGEEASILYRIVRPKSGEVRIIHGMAQVSRNLHGQPLKVFGVNQDITERVLAERALKESEQTLRKAQEVAKIGSWKLDMSSNILNWSAEAHKIFNIPEGIPVTQKDLLHYVHPEDREHVEKSWVSALKGDANDFVHRIIVNNKIKWVREQAELTVDEFGKPVCVFGTIQDITDQKFLQDIYLTFNQSQLLTQLGSWRWTIKTNALFWSDNTFNLYGLDKEKDEMTYETSLKAIHADDRDKVKAANDASLKTKEPFEIEYRVLIGTDIRWLQGKGNVLTDKNGDVLEMYGVVRDITDEKRDKEALEQARKASEEAASIKDEFLSVMSHEIRTPLNSVIGLSNLLLRRTPREDQLEVVKVLKSSADNLMHLVNDILDFNKIRSGNVQLEKIEFNLSEFLHEQYASSKITTQDKGLDFVIRVDSRIPRHLEGDATRLHQIFTNLLSNAIKFTHAGYVKLNADLVSIHGDQCLLRFSIEDSGVGIAADKLASVFEPFRQSGLDISRKYGGTGLGLSIVKSLVELMGGDIKLNSTPGEGSVFTIELAFGFNQSDAERAEPSRRQPRGAARSALKKASVLYVEDVASNRFLIENILSDNSIQCEVASSGRAALRLTKAKKFDVILMDIQMPGMDGYQAADKIRWQSEGKNRNTSIIAFTAEPYSSALKARTLEHDIQYIISKPFDQDVLIRKIKLYAKPEDNRGQLFTFSFYEEAFNHDGQKLHKIKKAVISDMRRFENALKKYDKEWDLERIRNEAHRIRPIVKNLGCIELRDELDKIRLHESLTQEAKTIIKETKKHLKKLLVKLENLDY